MTTKVQQPSRKKVISSHVFMFLCTIGIIVAARMTAYGLNLFYPPSYVFVRACEYIGYLGWGSTLGVMGWETLGTNTPAEKLDQNLAKIFSMIGIFAFVLARELVPLP